MLNETLIQKKSKQEKFHMYIICILYVYIYINIGSNVWYDTIS